jgi:hypothetical protein
VRQSQIPSCIIQFALRQYGQDTSEWKESDLNDRHLAGLSVYAHVTYVDKRTYETVTRLRRKNPEGSGPLRCVEKSSTYEQISNEGALPAGDVVQECW